MAKDLKRRISGDLAHNASLAFARKAFERANAQHEAELVDLGIAWFEKTYDKPLQRKMDAFPKGFFHEVERINFTVRGPGISGGFARVDVRLPRKIRIKAIDCASNNAAVSITTETELGKEASRLHDQRSQINSDFNALCERVRALIQSRSTVGKVIEAMPELEPFMPDERPIIQLPASSELSMNLKDLLTKGYQIPGSTRLKKAA